MENVNLNLLYDEIKSVKKELNELKKLREEARRELKEGTLISAEDLR